MYMFTLSKIQVSFIFFSLDKMKNVNYVFWSKNDRNLPIIMKIRHYFVYLKKYLEIQLSPRILIWTTLRTLAGWPCASVLRKLSFCL